MRDGGGTRGPLCSVPPARRLQGPSEAGADSPSLKPNTSLGDTVEMPCISTRLIIFVHFSPQRRGHVQPLSPPPAQRSGFLTPHPVPIPRSHKKSDHRLYLDPELESSPLPSGTQLRFGIALTVARCVGCRHLGILAVRTGRRVSETCSGSPETTTYVWVAPDCISHGADCKHFWILVHIL